MVGQQAAGAAPEGGDHRVGQLRGAVAGVGGGADRAAEDGGRVVDERHLGDEGGDGGGVHGVGVDHGGGVGLRVDREVEGSSLVGLSSPRT